MEQEAAASLRLTVSRDAQPSPTAVQHTTNDITKRQRSLLIVLGAMQKRNSVGSNKMTRRLFG
jgi:hypothetical protein